jgi:hypothetical protein
MIRKSIVNGSKGRKSLQPLVKKDLPESETPLRGRGASHLVIWNSFELWALTFGIVGLRNVTPSD